MRTYLSTIRFALCLLWTLLTVVCAQAQVQINAHVVPPYLSRVTDYASQPHLMVVTLTNTSTSEVQVQLTARITGDNGIAAWVKPGYRSPSPIVIQPGQTINLNGNDIAFLFDVNKIDYTGISRADMTRGLGLLEGSYTLCIRALQYQTLQPLSPEQTGCTTIRITDLEPPRILTPYNEQKVDTKGVQALPITWTTPPGSSPFIQYKLKIVEMVTPRNPNDAIQSTRAHYEETLNSNMLLYGPQYPALIPGRKYAMVVQAVDPTGMSNFRNRGISEVMSFTYMGNLLKAPLIISPEHQGTFSGQQQFAVQWNPIAEAPAQTEYTVNFYHGDQAGGKNKSIQSLPFYSHKVIGASELIYDFTKMPLLERNENYQVEVIAKDPNQQALFENEGRSNLVDFLFDAKIHRDTTKIKGRLVYQFKDDLTGQVYPIANERVYLSKVYATVSDDPNGLTQPKELSGSAASFFNNEEVFGGQYVTTDADGNFELPCFFTALDSAGVIPTDKWDQNLVHGGGSSNRLLNRYVENLKGKVGVFYKIAVLNPHFKASSELYNFTPGGERDLRQITLDANAYSLKVNVREVFNNLKGDYVENATVRIYREQQYKEEAHYGIPKYEGDILSDELYEKAIKDGKVLIAERKTPILNDKKNANEAYVTFNSLFKNLPSDPYNYKIVLMDGAVVLRETSFKDISNGLSASATDKNVKLNNIQAVQYTTNATVVNAVKNSLSATPKISTTANVKGVNMAINTTSTTKQVSAANQPALTVTAKGTSVFGTGVTQGAYTKDKWADYRYDKQPETAYLTLEKELHTPPRTKLTGTLKYAYKNKPGIPAQAYANMPLKLVVFYDYREKSTTALGVSNLGYTTGGSYYASVNRQLINFGYQNFLSTAKVETAIQGSFLDVGGKAAEDNYKVVQTVMTDQDGNFEFDFPNADPTGQYMDGVYGTGYGDLSSSMNVEIRRVYRLVPDVPYYCVPDEAIVVQPWESKDAGTYTSFVKTHHIRVQVSRVDRETDPQTAKPFANVPVNLYFDGGFQNQQYLPTIPGLDKNMKANVNTSAPNSGYNNTAAPSAPAGGSSSTGKGLTLLSYTANIGANYSGTLLSSGVVVQAAQQTVLHSLYSHLLMREGQLSDDRGIIEFKDVVRLSYMSGQKSLKYLLEADARGRENDVSFHQDYFLLQSARANRYVKDDVRGIEPESRTPDILFNKDLNPEEVQQYLFRLVPKSTLIRGRVTDSYTTLGIKGVKVKARVALNGKSYHNNNYDFLFEEWATTDENGYYSFPNLEKRIGSFNPDAINSGTVTTSKKNEISIAAPGYEPQTDNIGVLEPGLSGKQIVRNFALNPLGRGAFGYVMDAETGEPVTARVKLKVNGRWVDTEGALQKEVAFNSSLNIVAGQLAQTNFQATVNRSVNTGKAINIGNSGSKITATKNPQGKVTTTVTVADKKDLGVNIVEAAVLSNSKYGEDVQVLYSGSAKSSNTASATSGFSSQASTDLLNLNQWQLMLHYPYQRFVIDLPTKPDSIMILPYDPAYMPLTAAVHAKEPKANLGDFKLTRRKHKINVVVKTRDGARIPNAKVYIEGGGDDFKRTNGNGEVLFEFVNNSTSNFNIYVTNDDVQLPKSKAEKSGKADNVADRQTIGVEKIAFMPTSLNNVTSVDNQKVKTVNVTVDRANVLKGKVSFADDNQPVEGAVVYLEQGTGANSESQAITDANGNYTLLIPEPRPVRVPQLQRGAAAKVAQKNPQIQVSASYNEPNRTFVGVSRKITIQQESQVVNFAINEIKDIDISRLYGFDVRIKKLQARDEGYLISGDLINIPENADFKGKQLDGQEFALSFKDVQVGKSAAVNANKVPKAVPVEERVNLVEKNVRISAFKSFHAKLEGHAEYIQLSKGNTDTAGTIRGKVRLIDNSFNFPTSYMTISGQDFYLGKYAHSGSNKQEIEAFQSGATAEVGHKYAITKDQGKAITFKYLGFDGESGISGERESFVQNDSIHLFLTLKPKIQGGISLALNAGEAIITKDKLLPVKGDGPLEFKLEQWTVMSESWSLAPNSGGIVLRNNKILTGKTDLNLKKLSILSETNELVFDETDVSKQNLTVGGRANLPLTLEKGTEVVFAYDPDVGNIPGKGHFKFTLRNDKGTAASIEKLPGMTRAGDKIMIGYVSVLSNNEEVFGFSQNAKPITIQSQMSFTPGSFFSKEEGLVMNGTINLHLPKLMDAINGSISYYATDSGTPRLSIAPLEFSFIGDGGTKFKSISGADAQLFGGRGLGIAGEIQIPGSDASLKANLVSMVTSGVQSAAKQVANQVAEEAKEYAEEVISQAADAVKKQAEVVIGEYRKKGEEFAAELLDEVLKDETVRKSREFIENSLKSANDTYNEILKLGETGKQYYDALAAKMRLAGEGMNAVNTIIDGNPIGGFLQLNGVLKGAVGIDIVDAAKQKTKQVAMQAVKALQEELPVDNLADGLAQNGGGFSGAKFDFDFKTGRVFGALSMPKLVAGAVILNKVEMEMLFEREGWYFFAGADLNVPAVPLIFPLAVGIGIGNYNTVTPQMEAKFTSMSYVKKLPKVFKQNGFRGFLFTGRKDIIPETRFGVNFVVADFEVGFGAGFDARVYGSFNKQEQEVGIGAMLFAHAYARMAVLGGVCGVSGSVDAEVGVKATFKNTGGKPSISATGCFSAAIAARVWCAFIEKGINVSVMGQLTLCAGSSCAKEGVDFKFSRGSGSCSKDPDFDY